MVGRYSARAGQKAAPVWRFDASRWARVLATRHIDRLRRAEEFEAVLAHGTVRRSGAVFLRTYVNALGHPRLGIIASRKAMPRAVDRNRSKRLVREAFRAARNLLPAVDIVVQFRAGPPRPRLLCWQDAKKIFEPLTDK